jgi:flavin-dependent dehydrogenase
VLGEGGGLRIPNWTMPGLMNNHGNYIVSMGNVCRWMAEQAEELGVEIFPGMACSEMVYGDNGEVKGVVAGEFGKNPDGTPGDGYEPGMELHGKYVFLGEGVRGSLTKEVLAKYDLQAGKDPQKFGLGMKEIWEIDPEKHQEGKVMHTMGWPLGSNAGGGSFIYHLDNNQVYVGFVVHLNYENPYLYPYAEFQRFKHHPMVAELLKGGKRIAYGARAISEGGWQSMPKAVAPGVAILGCGVGLVNVPRIKGNHNAMLSGIEAAEAAAAALAEGRSSDELTAYDDVHPQGRADREGPQAGAQRQAALVEIRASGRCRPGWRRHVDGQPHRLEPVRHDAPREIGCRRHGQGEELQADRLSPARWRAELRPPDQCQLLDDQPRGKPARAPDAQGRGRSHQGQPARICRARAAVLPGRSLRGR